MSLVNTKAGLRSISVGPLAVNCYILYDEESRDAAVIDPGGDGPGIIHLAGQLGVNIRVILNTHGHCDHCGANPYVREKTGARIGIHQEDAGLLESIHLSGASTLQIPYEPHKPDFFFGHADNQDVGGLRLLITHTPGHTRGGCCFFLKDDGYGNHLLFTGDTLFAGSIGRTDLHSGSYNDIMKSLDHIIREFPPETRVYPGHGPSTILSREIRSNPYLEQL